ncbi:hypothetical protein ACVGVM_16975 [Pseudonocardia bannensis]|uniref:Uncharacterized protein n=1 Tax=Pseudonocardia bannensis TaxID=630973 RepID=A0A848DGI6_9PSEU|nr:hypothetical protein [Pseudonocardia bannensis]NMH91686.1 hypothetical protein [Pseudonocardia bannensis]
MLMALLDLELHGGRAIDGIGGRIAGSAGCDPERCAGSRIGGSRRPCEPSGGHRPN